MTARLSRVEARQRIDEICQRIDGKPASAKTMQPKPFDECADPQWWLGGRVRGGSDLNRRTALLTAYVDLGGSEFPLTGIPLSDGFLRPDKSVMCELIHAGMVEIVDDRFRLTPAGRNLISGSGGTAPEAVALQPGTEQDGRSMGGGGEGANHRALRLWVLESPAAIFPGLAQVAAQTEYLLPSADRIDVLYESPGRRIALEVKSRDSNAADLARGIYQCVKYRAVLRAITTDDAVSVEAALVVESALSPQLKAEAQRLDIDVILITPDRSV